MSTLYVSDLDGTLLNSKAELSKKSIEIINSLVKKGVKFTYATARSFSSASKIVLGLELTIPVITYNGAFCVLPRDGKIAHSTSFSDEQIKYISEIFMKHGVYQLVYSMLQDKERVSFIIGKENEGISYYLKSREGDKRLRFVKTVEELYQGSIFYFTAIGEKEDLEPLVHYFEDKTEYIFTFQPDYYRKNDYWFEIMPRDATKAMGIVRLKEITGCDRVVCFGDAINDISMFDIADEAYAVKGANPGLKEISTGVIGSNDEDGVALWLQENAL